MQTQRKQAFILIGAGRVGKQLALRLHACGYPIKQIISRTLTHAEDLAQLVHAQASNSINNLHAAAEDIIIIAVNDNAILHIAEQLAAQNCNQLVVHTSGAFHTHQLAHILPRVGSFYPLMTFHAQSQINWKQIPIGVWGNKTKILSL